MAIRRRSVLAVACHLNGVRSGYVTGMRLSTAQRNVVESEANNLCKPRSIKW